MNWNVGAVAMREQFNVVEAGPFQTMDAAQVKWASQADNCWRRSRCGGWVG